MSDLGFWGFWTYLKYWIYIPETAEKQMARQRVSAFLITHVYNKIFINKSYFLQFFSSIYQFRMFFRTHFATENREKRCQRSL